MVELEYALSTDRPEHGHDSQETLTMGMLLVSSGQTPVLRQNSAHCGGIHLVHTLVELGMCSLAAVAEEEECVLGRYTVPVFAWEGSKSVAVASAAVVRSPCNSLGGLPRRSQSRIQLSQIGTTSSPTMSWYGQAQRDAWKTQEYQERLRKTRRQRDEGKQVTKYN